jgi:hypothetical protein
MAPFKLFFLLFGSLTMCSVVNAQDCTLAIGGRDADIIIQVFQLNNEQIAKMQGWGAELEKEMEAAQTQIDQLLESHPQETPEQLAQLATKYKGLQDRIVEISKSYDKKLLAIFNERQYRRYVGLCREVFLKPLPVTRN